VSRHNPINILVPMAGQSVFFQSKDHYFPKPIIDIEGSMMIERVISSLNQLNRERKFLFVVNETDAAKFHLSKILRLIAGESCDIFEQIGNAMGAICSCLLHIEHIDNEFPLVISNADQIIDVNYDEVINHFEARKVDGGTITFHSYHPQWSYVSIDESGMIVEAAEKKPISCNAIAGFYYFRKGSMFVEAAKRVIKSNAKVNEIFYISSCFNELILQGRRLSAFNIDSTQYHSFYAPEMIEKYRNVLRGHLQ
jgi:dTDP-glucose pyrophosphorylase